jgi:hypothetical protein
MEWDGLTQTKQASNAAPPTRQSSREFYVHNATDNPGKFPPFSNNLGKHRVRRGARDSRMCLWVIPSNVRLGAEAEFIEGTLSVVVDCDLIPSST